MFQSYAVEIRYPELKIEIESYEVKNKILTTIKIREYILNKIHIEVETLSYISEFK